jgi:hypothetical protein
MPLIWRDELKKDDPLFQQGVAFAFKTPQTASTDSSSEQTEASQEPPEEKPVA